MKKEATGSAVLGVFHVTLEKHSCGGAGFPTAEHPGCCQAARGVASYVITLCWNSWSLGNPKRLQQNQTRRVVL